MSKPPATPPSSDISGVNRDARAGAPSGDDHPEPGSSLDNAKSEGKGHPHENAPSDPDSSGS